MSPPLLQSPSPSLLLLPGYTSLFPSSAAAAATLISPQAVALGPCLRPSPLHLRRRRCRRMRRPPAALPISAHELLRAASESLDPLEGRDDAARTQLPAIRSYEADLAALTIVGAVSSVQAITAAAADGGDAAQEHLSAGTSTMVVETVFPGAADERSTVSTRLFLAASEVKAKARKLKSSLTANILSSDPTVSKNILAMTFRQVVVQRLWSFKLSLFCPGTQRNMEDLAGPREAPSDFIISSSDTSFLSVLAEVVCSCALEETKRKYLGNAHSSRSNNMFNWFQKPQSICSVDSSICVYRIPDHEVFKSAIDLMDKLDFAKGKSSQGVRKLRHHWWMAPTFSRSEEGADAALISWTNEFVPAFRLEIDVHKFEGLKLEGGKDLSDNRWDVLLTHCQMVELANILDMYYEDRYTLPDKQLFCGLVMDPASITKNKVRLWKKLIATLGGTCIILLVSILAQAFFPRVANLKKAWERNNGASCTKTESRYLISHETAEVKASCLSVVQKIKDALGWDGETIVDANGWARIGLPPSFLMNTDLALDVNSGEHTTVDPFQELQPQGKLLTELASCQQNDIDDQKSLQDIASYQVVMSSDGRIVGFQPTNRVALNQWTSNPLTKVLYEGRELSPGFLEPRLKVPLPQEVVVLELLMSVNPESSFALARPIEQVN